MAATQPAFRHSREPHIHVAGLTCPVCEQPIPNEKSEEVRVRLEARDKQLSDTAVMRAAQQFATEKAQLEAAAKQILERVRKENAEALTKLANETTAKVAAARDEGSKAAQAAAQERIATLEKTGRERDADWRDKITKVEGEKQSALRRCETLKATHEDAVKERVQEAREVLEKDKTDALNAAQAAHTAETQKLTGKLEDLKRQLEKKTAEELGEGAEVKLFESLRTEFDGDRIQRVGKGNSGADILHTVIHNGRECGTIVYDSKNSTVWRGDYVAKLVQDQTAAKADHAVLCVRKFPADTKQLVIRDGVIVINPAHAITMVHIIRKHMVQVEALRLSKTERAKKMAALYDFITSERCGHLLARVDSHTESLLEMQAKEIKTHEDNWKKQGTHLRSIQKAKAQLETAIDGIISTDDGTDATP